MTLPSLGVYEKALPANQSWEAILGLAREGGFDFFELAIDETQHRMARLDWSSTERHRIRKAIDESGMPIAVVTLSAHRAIPMGSASRTTRARAIALLDQTIALAADLGSSVVQVAGYFVFDEEHHPDARRWFIDGLAHGCISAAAAGVRLGLENVDGIDIVSIDDALAIVHEINDPTLGLFPDVGNLAANGLEVASQLEKAAGHILAVDLKDTRPGVFRRVPYGEGVVPFVDVFDTLHRIGFTDRFAVEMWNEDAVTGEAASQARQWLVDQSFRCADRGSATP